MPHRREGIMAPTNPAVRVRITVIRTPQIGFAGANRIWHAEAMSNGGLARVRLGQEPAMMSVAMRGWSRTLDATELAWHRANSGPELRAFLESGVRWAECDVRLDPSGVACVSHDPIAVDDDPMELTEWLAAVKGGGRSPKVDLKEGGSVIGDALEAISRVGFADDDLWFNAAVEIPQGREGFVRLARAHPSARISCPLDTLSSYLLVAPPTFEVVEVLRSWGVNWLCFGSCVPGIESLVPAMQERGWPVNIWDVENERDLERALSLRPEAITADLAAIQG